jgi:hypothetical protein
MTGNEGSEYACPECGADIPADAKSCPGCGVDFAWDEGAEAEGAGQSVPEDAPEPEEEGEELEEIEVDAGHSVEGPAAPAKERRAAPPETVVLVTRRRYASVFSIVGVTFLVLAVVAVIGTVVVMNWDVWVSGASKESIGPRQSLFIDLGFLAIVICILVVVFDLLRLRK